MLIGTAPEATCLFNFFGFRLPALALEWWLLSVLSSPDAMPADRPNLTLDEQYLQRVLSAAFTIQKENDERTLARQILSRQTREELEAQSKSEILPSNWATVLMSQDRLLRPELSAQIRESAELAEGAKDSSNPSSSKRRKTPKRAKSTAVRRRRDRLGEDRASIGSLAVPIANEPVNPKETFTEKKAEIVPDQVLDISVLDSVEANGQRIAETAGDLTPADLAIKPPELTVQPFPSFPEDSSAIDTRANAPTGIPIDASGASVELLNSVPDHLLVEIVRQALRMTRATGAAIAFRQQGRLVCRTAAGYSASEIDAIINPRSGSTGGCSPARTSQLCGNVVLGSSTNTEACRRLGVRASIVVPLLHQDQSLGLIGVFSRQPYAFGMHDLQALEDLAEKFALKLQLGIA